MVVKLAIEQRKKKVRKAQYRKYKRVHQLLQQNKSEVIEWFRQISGKNAAFKLTKRDHLSSITFVLFLEIESCGIS